MARSPEEKEAERRNATDYDNLEKLKDDCVKLLGFIPKENESSYKGDLDVSVQTLGRGIGIRASEEQGGKNQLTYEQQKALARFQETSELQSNRDQAAKGLQDKLEYLDNNPGAVVENFRTGGNHFWNDKTGTLSKTSDGLYHFQQQTLFGIKVGDPITFSNLRDGLRALREDLYQQGKIEDNDKKYAALSECDKSFNYSKPIDEDRKDGKTAEASCNGSRQEQAKLANAELSYAVGIVDEVSQKQSNQSKLSRQA